MLSYTQLYLYLLLYIYLQLYLNVSLQLDCICICNCNCISYYISLQLHLYLFYIYTRYDIPNSICIFYYISLSNYICICRSSWTVSASTARLYLCISSMQVYGVAWRRSPGLVRSLSGRFVYRRLFIEL